MDFNVLNFGAVPDGVTLNTDAIKSALAECERQGGGRLIFPEGVFLSGSVELCSNTELHLVKDAVLKASGDPDHFPPNGFLHNEMGQTTSLIWARNKENILISGEGTIDINSSAYYPDTAEKIYLGERNEENSEHFVFEKNLRRINQPVFFESCKNIAVKGIKLINSTCWTVTFSRSEDIEVDGVTIRNSVNVPNDDGIHLSASRHARVKNCDISCLDDCVAVTSITAKGQENSDITVENCHLSSRSSAIRLGHKVKNVRIENIKIYNNNRGIGMFTAAGGYIQDVTVKNVAVDCRLFCSVCWGKGEAVVMAATFPETYIKNIKIENLVGAAANGILIYGENNISEVAFKNIDIALKKSGAGHNFIDLRPYHTESADSAVAKFIKGAENVTFTDVNIAEEKC